MSDPSVYQVGRIADADGILLRVGVEYGVVTIDQYRLTAAMAEEFARLFTAACWQAAMQLSEMGEAGE